MHLRFSLDNKVINFISIYSNKMVVHHSEITSKIISNFYFNFKPHENFLNHTFRGAEVIYIVFINLRFRVSTTGMATFFISTYWNSEKCQFNSETVSRIEISVMAPCHIHFFTFHVPINSVSLGSMHSDLFSWRYLSSSRPVCLEIVDYSYFR